MAQSIWSWTRKDAALTDTFSIQQGGVDRTCPRLQFVEVLQAAPTPQIFRVVDHGLDAQRAPVLHILLDAGVPVEGVDVDLGAVGDDVRLVLATTVSAIKNTAEESRLSRPDRRLWYTLE